MRKHVFGRQLQRDTNERKALFKSLMSALIINESIKTTEAKAKAIRGQMEKLVTKARTGSKEAQRLMQGYFTAPVLKKFFDDVAPRFATRPGGYTRIIKIGNRFADNAKMVVLEWVEKPVKVDVINPTIKSEKKETKTEKVAATAKVKSSAKAKKEVKETPKKEKVKEKKSTKKK